MIHYLFKISWLNFSVLFAFYSVCFGSGGSVISVGALGIYGGNETGYRQLIRLSSNGDLHKISPKNSSIQMITLYAPGMAHGELIIRELDLPDGEKSILISAPNRVHAKIKRATVYLVPPSNNFLLFQEHETGWERLEPIKLIASPYKNMTEFDEYWAYSVTHLGHFRISNGVALSRPDNALNSNSGLFPMGSISFGFFPWMCAGILFIIIGILSHIIHKVECRGTN